MSDKLLVYTKKNKEIPECVFHKDLFVNLFDSAISRTDHKLDHFLFKPEAETIKNLLSLPNLKLSWDECCLKRALELLELKKEKYYLSYSGGIDSTSLLVAILKTWPEDALARIVLVISSFSMEENPVFFSKYLLRFPWINFMAGLDFISQEKNTILITGDLGDQLFGSLVLHSAAKTFGEAVFQKDYKDHAEKIFSQWIIENPASGATGKKLFVAVEPIVAECPFEIKKVCDYFWWIDFSQRWQSVKFKYLESKRQNLDLRYKEKIIHFFDTVYFQHWSLDNPDLKIKDTWESYKFINKEFIYKFTKDPFHLKMLKYPSVGNTYLFTENRMAIDQHYKEVQSVEAYARK